MTLDDIGIKPGDILTMLTMIGTGIAVMRRNDRSHVERNFKLDRCILDIENIHKKVEIMNTTVNEVSKQKMQIDLLMKWYDELRHGVGIVISPER